MGKQSVDLARSIVDAEALSLVPEDIAKRHRLVPLRWDSEHRRLTIAIADVDDIVAIDKLSALLPDDSQVESLIAGESEIAHAIDQYYGFELSIDGILTEIETGEIDYRSLASSDEYNQPIVRLIDALMADAVKHEASDIHFEPEASFLRIRYRIDGILRQIRVLHKSYWAAMAVRIKVISNLNIAENPRTAGRKDFLECQGTSGRFSRIDSAHDSWRKCSSPNTRPSKRLGSNGPVGAFRSAIGYAKAHDRPPRGDHFVHWPDGQWKDNHTLFNTESHQC